MNFPDLSPLTKFFAIACVTCVPAWAGDWVEWNPPGDPFTESALDLRALNEKQAGMHGPVRVENGRFVLGDGTPVRFWAVNGPPEDLRGDALRQAAKTLAKRGVNLVRIHKSVFDSKTGAFRPDMVAKIQETVAAMKAEGIYVHLSIYFPLWFTPEPGLEFLEGYDGSKHPFAALMFHRKFQEVYRQWWTRLLTEKLSPDSPPLIEDPAVFGLEIQNEDSFFFWTFNPENIPPPLLAELEGMFSKWVHAKYGSYEAALAAWNGLRMPGDDPEAGRIAFRPLFQIFHDRTVRDQDTARFLAETQRGFYDEQIKFLRELGFRGLVTASNWKTANNAILGPLEKYSYLGGDFIDRHGYWGGTHSGENAAWSIREGHVFSHRSALRFDPAKPGGAREIGHPVFDTKVNGLPSMISETTFTRPNRYRVEGPLFYAAYGALQGSDAIVHFAFDGAEWSVKPNFWMQPWTLMSPTQMGQFPAAALIYRKGLLKEGVVAARIGLPLADAFALKGSPLVESQNLDELRKGDAVVETTGGTASVDPRVHLIGRTELEISENPKPTELPPLAEFIDDQAQVVRSSTGELTLNHGKGLLRIAAPQVEGLVGALAEADDAKLSVLALETQLDLGAVVLVALDDQPLVSSRRMLLQVGTEERPSGWSEEPQPDGLLRILSIGKNPWQIAPTSGTVRIQRPDSAALRVTKLDGNGYPLGSSGNGSSFELVPGIAYYLIEAPAAR
jgi:hypothetical protein